MIIVTLSMMAGMVAFAYYDMIGCDPLKAGAIENPNQVSLSKVDINLYHILG